MIVLLFGFVFIVIVIVVLGVLYSVAPRVYGDNRVGIYTRTDDYEVGLSNNKCDVCGKSNVSGMMEVYIREFVVNGKAILTIYNEETPLCNEHYIEPDDLDKMLDSQFDEKLNERVDEDVSEN